MCGHRGGMGWCYNVGSMGLYPDMWQFLEGLSFCLQNGTNNGTCLRGEDNVWEAWCLAGMQYTISD